MNIMSEDGMIKIAELFIHMPNDLFQKIFLDKKVIVSEMLTPEEVDFYLKNLRTNIIMSLIIGIQKTKDGLEHKFIARCNELFKSIVTSDSPIDKQLKEILKANNISTKPN